MNKFLSSMNVKGRFFLSFVLGMGLVGALPPFFYLPITIVSFSGFFLLLQYCETKKQAFWTGWFFGFGYFLLGVYWVANSLLVEAERFAWLIPFSISLIPAISALFIGIVGVIGYITKISPARNVLIFACVWTLMEILRGLITQFPWNFVGYMWLDSGNSYMAQFSSVVGVSGMSLLLVLFATMPAILWLDGQQELSFIKRWQPIFVVYLIVTIIWFWGFSHVNQDVTQDIALEEKTTTIRIVQPNIPQIYKHDPSKQFEIFNQQLKMTATKAKGDNPDIIIWPEAAIGYSIQEDELVQKSIANAIPPESLLITGGMRYQEVDGKQKAWNSLFVVNKDAEIVANYDKHILVPFGEFVPFQQYLPFIDKITQGSTGFSRGDGVKTINIDGWPSFSPLICYEVVFASDVADSKNRPEFMLNITNDAWFGDTMGPYQHLHMTRMRAIEQKLPLIRVANTGISAFIDKYGRIITQIGLNKSGMEDVVLPKSDKLGQTMFSRYGNIIPLIIIFLIIFWCLRYLAAIQNGKNS